MASDKFIGCIDNTDQGNMVADASSEEGEMVNYAHVYKGKIISLFETGVAHDLIAFQCGCSCTISAQRTKS